MLTAIVEERSYEEVIEPLINKVCQQSISQMSPKIYEVSHKRDHLARHIL